MGTIYCGSYRPAVALVGFAFACAIGFARWAVVFFPVAGFAFAVVFFGTAFAFAMIFLLFTSRTTCYPAVPDSLLIKVSATRRHFSFIQIKNGKVKCLLYRR